MKGIMFMFGLIGILVMGNFRRSDMTQLRVATAEFQRLETAQAAGYRPVSDLNLCLNNTSGFGGLGYRYSNNDLIDANVDPLQPEALIYVPGPNGVLQLGAVEYIVPVAAWNATQAGWPQLMGHQFHLNPGIEAYVLHIWAWENNPSGMFEYWNPTVSCS